MIASAAYERNLDVSVENKQLFIESYIQKDLQTE